MVDAGIALMLGSDAPVSPLDPWLAMAAAVHRSGDQRSPLHQEQAITVAEAERLHRRATTLGVGSRGDIALLDADPLAVPTEGEGSPARGIPEGYAGRRDDRGWSRCPHLVAEGTLRRRPQVGRYRMRVPLTR